MLINNKKRKVTTTNEDKIWCILFIPLNLWTRSIPSTTRICESADVMRTFDELPGANCLDKLISNWKVSTGPVSQSKHTNHLYKWKSAEQGESKIERNWQVNCSWIYDNLIRSTRW